MKHLQIFSIFCLSSTLTFAQLDSDLIAWISFDHCETIDDSKNRNHAYFSTKPTCGCGVSGQALELNGINDYLQFDEDLNPVLNSMNFTLSFYFKSYAGDTRQNLFSRAKDCQLSPMLEAWLRGDHFNVVYLSKIKDYRISQELPSTCWKHISLVRKEQGIQLYVNGELLAESLRKKPLWFDDSAVLMFGNSPCVSPGTLEPFKGLIDEIRIYKRALNAGEIQEIFESTYTNTLILNEAAVLCKGDAVQIETQGICQDDQVRWFPETGLSDPTNPNPVIRPEQSETYYLEVDDGSGQLCVEGIDLEIVNNVHLNLGREKRTLCKGDSIFINAYTPGATYLWQDGSTNAQMLIKASGWYWVEISQGGCSLSDTIYVSDELCEGDCVFNFPDALELGKESFQAIGCVPKTWMMKVYDLNGKICFESNDFEEAWFGEFEKEYMPKGKYIWQLVYENEAGDAQFLKGFIDLL